MNQKIIIAGHGGQGIVVAGSLLANTAIFENKHVTGMVSYGVEMRGGTANSALIISDKPIGSPVIEKATALIIMNQPSLDRFENMIEPNGLLVLNTSMIERFPKRKDIEVLKIDATNIADDIGNSKAANILMIGAFIKKTNIVDLKNALELIPKVLPKKEMWEINKKALLKGAELCI